jgi:hypothetical protein
MVTDLGCTTGSETALFLSLEDALIEWQVTDLSPGERIDWACAKRQLRELTCEERAQCPFPSLYIGEAASEGFSGPQPLGLLTRLPNSCQWLSVPQDTLGSMPLPPAHRASAP